MSLIGETSDLDRLEYGSKPVLPEQQSYSTTTPDGTVVSSVAGGLPKSQLQYMNQPYKVSVTYKSLDAFKSAYLENFFALHQGQAFIASLLIGGTEVEEFVVKYLGDTTHARTGLSGSMSVDLIVEPAIDRCFQSIVQEWGACRGSDTASIWCNTNLGVKALP
ncbi:hypothetical protein NVP1198B_39 [Vibrio phage 1.198.B._10N.286.54.F4]|nr:hypothetical protein NVP1198A_40 [Vibrio phage 1.198.A._10N.286.54.F4]AUR94827.1 hypothetical protein NVP1198B_39 [Vibrio phage 1.198.B._10N.286.54.F4]